MVTNFYYPSLVMRNKKHYRFYITLKFIIDKFILLPDIEHKKVHKTYFQIYNTFLF